MTAANPQNDSASPTSLALWLVGSAVVVGIVAGVLFYLHPEIDIAAAGVFRKGEDFLGDRPFVGHTPFLSFLRNFLVLIFLFICLVAIVGAFISRRMRGGWLGLSNRKWLFVVACLAIGPGLIVNQGFKNYWGRARPMQIVEFGGSKTYTPPLTPSSQCHRNCSFVSGEASNVFILFFVAMFLFPHRALALFAIGIGVGSLVGVMRMAQGAHFLSDIVFAGVAMAITAGVVALVFGNLEAPDTHSAGTKADGPVA
jgi:lipid A 4'-phosphatase